MDWRAVLAFEMISVVGLLVAFFIGILVAWSMRRRTRISHELGVTAEVERAKDKSTSQLLFRRNSRRGDELGASVIAPKSVQLNNTFRLWVIVSKRSQVRQLSARRAKEASLTASPATTLSEKIERGAELVVVLTGPALEHSEIVRLRWQGRVLEASFQVRIPDTFHETRALFDVSIFYEGLCLGVIAMDLDIGQTTAEPENSTKELVLPKRIFVSYSSHDRDVALTIARAYMRLDIETFLDVLILRGGELWEERLGEEIDRSDAILLLWSEHAAASEYVLWEVKRALQRRLINPERRPVILTHLIGAPPPAPWPRELGKLHFNDPTLAAWEQSIRAARAQQNSK